MQLANITLKFTSTDILFQGTVYVVVKTHYMGMDGSYTELLASFTDEEVANKYAQKKRLRCNHAGHESDSINYSVVPIELRC